MQQKVNVAEISLEGLCNEVRRARKEDGCKNQKEAIGRVFTRYTIPTEDRSFLELEIRADICKERNTSTGRKRAEDLAPYVRTLQKYEVPLTEAIERCFYQYAISASATENRSLPDRIKAVLSRRSAETQARKEAASESPTTIG